MRLTAICLMICVSLGAAPAIAEERTITVIGEGRVTEVPDQAVITVGASQRSSSPQMAMESVGEIITGMIKELDKAGIEPRDMQTSGLGLRPVYDRNRNGDERPLLLGFDATNRLTVTVRDINRVGEVLAALVDAGATDISGVTFGLNYPLQAQDAARRDAVTDARAKATLYAVAAEVKLGKVLSISEIGGGMPRPEMMRASMASLDSVPIAAGELSVTAQIQMVIELRD